MSIFPLRRQRALASPPTLVRQVGLVARNTRFSARAKLALRLASIAALATGGVALGRGVVGIANSRSHLVEVAGVSVSRADAHAASPPGEASAAVERDAPPVFTSSIRSWAEATAAPVPSVPADQQVNPAATPGVRPETYTVTPGDTLSQIADRYAVDVNVLATANHLTDVNALSPGVQLRIPVGVVKGSNGPFAAAQPTTRPVQLPVQTPVAPPVQLPAGQPSTSAAAGATIADTASSPEAAIRSFYALVEQGQFDQAAGLWSQHMRSTYPPADNITSRFAHTQALTVNRADVVQLDPANGRATVVVSLSEVLVGSQPSSTRHYVGNWYLVRGQAGWLLDQPSLQSS